MPIIFYCHSCGREIRARSSAAGKRGRCVDCDTEIVIPDFHAARQDTGASQNQDSAEIPNPPVGFLEDEAADEA
jgi:hypothetical protein